MTHFRLWQGLESAHLTYVRPTPALPCPCQAMPICFSLMPLSFLLSLQPNPSLSALLLSPCSSSL